MLYAKLKKAIFILFAVILAVMISGCTSKADEYNESGLEYYESGDYDSAVSCFDEAISRNGKKTEYYINKCFALIAKEDYSKATDSINSAYMLEPESKYVLRAQGILYYRTEKYPEAIESFDKCLEQVGNYVTDFEYDILMYKADAEISSGLSQEAIDTYSVLIATQKDNKQFYYWRAKAHIMAGDEADAVDDFKNYILRSGDYDSYLQIYYELKNAGYEKSASDILNRALQLSDRSVSDLKYRGMIYYLLGDYNKAITELQKIDENDKSSEICIYEGMAFAALGDLDNASDFYEKAVKKGGSDAVLFYEIAVCNITLGHYEDAIYYITRGIETSDEEYKEKLMYIQIICYEYSHRYSEAAESVSEYIETFGSTEEMEHELAFLRSRME